ncbi:MAG: 2OG-Fe(II) oxygenase [Bacteroidetes bacterium]|nr:2OG-Fe(II) oxygenase [Bacteroidota bacterium]
MNNIQERLQSINWIVAAEDMHARGYAQVPALLSNEECDELIKAYDESKHYRKTISMERYRFGLGEYKYFNYPLPSLIQSLREHIYPQLAPIANAWMSALKIDKAFPGTLQALQEQCHSVGQNRPTVLILKYGEGGHNTLHQDLYGEVYFPMQLVIFLSEPDDDYTGGEFVLTQQTPRAQSKAMVLKPRKGDMLLFTTNFRPIKGTKGYYRVNMKHGVSELHSGRRYTLGIIFHDALS